MPDHGAARNWPGGSIRCLWPLCRRRQWMTPGEIRRWHVGTIVTWHAAWKITITRLHSSVRVTTTPFRHATLARHLHATRRHVIVTLHRSLISEPSRSHKWKRMYESGHQVQWDRTSFQLDRQVLCLKCSFLCADSRIVSLFGTRCISKLS